MSAVEVRDVSSDLTHRLYQGLRFSLVATGILTALTILALYTVVDGRSLALWGGVMLATTLGRALLLRCYRQSDDPSSMRHLRRFRVGAVCAGLGWGMSAILIFPTAFPAYQILLVFVLAGASVGSLATLSFDRCALIGFLSCVLLPLCLRFFWIGTEVFLVMGLMTLFFIAFIFLTADRLWRNVHENTVLRLQVEQHDRQTRYAQSRVKNLLDLSPVVLYRCSAEGSDQVVFVSDNIEMVFGYTPASLLGAESAWLSHLHPDDRAGLIALRGSLLPGVVRSIEYRVLFPSGAYRWVRDSLRLVAHELSDGYEIVGSWADIDGEKQHASELVLQQALMNAIRHVQTSFILNEDPAPAFERVLDDVLRFTESAYGFVGEVLRDENGPYLKTHAITNIAWNEETQLMYAQCASEGLAFHNLQNLFGHVVLTQQVLISNDPAHDPHRGGLPHGHPDLNAFLGVPIMADGQMVGMLGVANREGGYDVDLVDRLEPLTGAIGQIMMARRADAARKKAQDSASRLALVVEKTTNGVVISDVHGRVEWANEAMSSLTGYSIEELIGQKPGELLQGPLTSAEAVAELSAALTRHEPFEGVLLNYAKDGSQYWVNLRIDPIFDDGVCSGFIAIEHDVTEQRRQTELHREWLARLQKITSQVPGVVYQYKQRADGTGCFPYASDGIREVYQTTPESVRHDASAVFELIHPEDRQGVVDSIALSGKNMTPWRHEYRVRYHSGIERWLQGNALPEPAEDGAIVWHGFISDTTVFKQTQQAELEVRAQLQALIDASTQFSMIATNTEGLITLFNTGAEKLLGYAREEMIGLRTPACFHDPDEILARGQALSYELQRDISGFSVFVESALLGRSEMREWTYICKDGSRLTVSLAVSAIRNRHGVVTGFLGVASDITARRQMENALKESQQRYQLAVRGSTDGIWDWNIAAADTYYSPRFRSLLGYENEALPERFDTFIERNLHPDDKVSVQKSLERHLQDWEPYDVSHRLLTRKGEWRWFRARAQTQRDRSGLPVRMTGSISDISALKQAEVALAASAAHTQLILDNVMDGIVTINELGMIQSFNQAAERIFGYSSAEILGCNVKMLMPLPYSVQHDGYLQNYLRTGRAQIIGVGREVTGLRKSGDVFPMELAITEIMSDDKILFIGMVRDITERKRVEKLKSEFVSTVSHELRTPVTSIRGALGMVAAGTVGELTPPAAKLVGIAQKNCDRLSLLINDLLDMEKIAAGRMSFDMKVCEVLPLLVQVIEANQPYGDQFGVKFVLSADVESPVYVKLDSQRFIQVLSNFLSNAAKFSPAGGSVELSLLPNFEIGVVRISVRDYGPGISAEFQKRLFQKFSQEDSSDTRQKGGTGLGLAISKELVEGMGGTIGFVSESNQGATFFVDFSLVDSAH